VLALLLPVLAILQHQWIGTLSQGEQVRMRRALHASVMRFSDDLNKILEQAHTTFQLAPSRNAEHLATSLGAQYKTWQATAPYPDLIAVIYLVRSDTINGPRLVRFDAGQNRLTEVAWPDSLATWRTYFSSTNAVQNQIPDAVTSELFLPANPTGVPIPLIAPFDAEDAPPTPQAPDHVLLILDTAVLYHTILPALTQTHFSEDNTLAYDVLIQSRSEPQHLVYRSAPDLTFRTFNTPDLATDIGQFRWMHVMTYATDETVGRYVFIVHRDSSLAAMAVRLINQGLADDQITFLDPTFVDSDRRETLRRSVTPAPGTPLQLEAALETETGIRAPDTSSTGKVWNLRVQHRAGSIEAAVTSMRRRNLAVSLGILLILGLAGGLFYLSLLRARRLAEQQTAFVAGVSHELRTPLAVIRSAAENLADGLVENPEQARRYGQLIDTEGRRLSEVVEQTLALAGIQGPHATLNLQPVEMAPLLDQALARCHRDLDDTEVILDVASDLPPVQADAMALEAALCNLITNAHKYGDGWLRLEVQKVMNGQTSEIQITVRDRGAGIPAHEQPHLFEPFYRGAAARAAQIRGSGLGLSLVKQTVEAHGGHVSMKSAAGQGSAFTIHLPVASS